jgi:excisionase family DNA binding protein
MHKTASIANPHAGGGSMDVIFDIRGAAEYLHIKKWTLYRLAKKGKVPGIKVGGQWRFKKEVLDNMFYGEGQKQRKRQPPSD